MPDESNPGVDIWGKKISSELSKIRGKVSLVAHSVGGSILLQYLAGADFGTSISGLFMLAVPTWDDKHWNFDDLKPPPKLAATLSLIPLIYFYHCRDDDIVPFAHLALHAAQIPRAIIRPMSRGGHQFGNDLTRIAIDIRGDDAG